MSEQPAPCPFCSGPALHVPATYGPGGEPAHTGCSACQIFFQGSDSMAFWNERVGNPTPEEAARYQALGLACEGNGLAGYEDGKMWFQPPGDLIHDQAFQAAYDAAAKVRRRPHPYPPAVAIGAAVALAADRLLFARFPDDLAIFLAVGVALAAAIAILSERISA